MPAEQNTDIAAWITRVNKCADARAVFALLKEFRALPWNDDDRARMSKAYIRVLERVGAPPPDDSADSAAQEKDDGSVWYERM